MAVWCTQNARAQTAAVPRGTSHVTTKQRCKYTSSVGIKLVTHLESQCRSLNLISLMVHVGVKRHVYLLTQVTITFCERNLKHHDHLLT